ncbi:MAG: hypothetical protein V1894_05995 [Chloroflexota bacterium]
MSGIYATQPKIHRTNVTSVDATDPPDTTSAVDTRGYRECRFDLTITGTALQSLEVQALFWNPRQSLWMGGGKRIFNTTGRHALIVECNGAIIFLEVTGFSGGSFSLSADYVLS